MDVAKSLSNLRHYFFTVHAAPSVPVRPPLNVEHFAGLNDVQVRSLLLSLGARAIAVLGSMVFTYYLVRYITKHLDPTQDEKKRQNCLAQAILKQMKLEKHVVNSFNEYELCLIADIINPDDISVQWEDIGGMDNIISNVRQTIIYPLQHPQLFMTSKLLTTPKGVLFYGPPGCGKTMLAKAIAKEAGATFINLQVTSLLDKWYGESQKRTNAIFTLAKKLQPSIIFIDEIDSFMRTRQSDDHESTRMIKTQFMTLWDGLETDCQNNRILIIGATNRPQDLDQAILRRMAAKYFISMPNIDQRLKILNLILKDENLNDNVNLNDLARQTESYTGSDLNEICRQAAMERVIELCSGDANHEISAQQQQLRSISQDDFSEALRKVRTDHQTNHTLTILD